jgi:hypothetical protein
MAMQGSDMKVGHSPAVTGRYLVTRSMAVPDRHALSRHCESQQEYDQPWQHVSQIL